MAYETHYTLEISEQGPSIEAIAEWLTHHVEGTAPGAGGFPISVRHWTEILWGDTPATWYEHNEDMKKVSLAYPDVIFTLTGRGGENDDCWTAYHQNGKSYTLWQDPWDPPPFDAAKLQPSTGKPGKMTQHSYERQIFPPYDEYSILLLVAEIISPPGYGVGYDIDTIPEALGDERTVELLEKHIPGDVPDYLEELVFKYFKELAHRIIQDLTPEEAEKIARKARGQTA